jgi:DNA-binding SARP family transcriptional activator/basic membrane lipoprotein Med (substrate-binding protein (PBP1-ABC) superfamily)
MEFSVLGPLEARVGGEPVSLGGAEQRAVLAALLLRANEIVAVERVIDEVWGDSPPPSAAHSLEAYISRLRQLFNGHGPSLVRRGPGYSLELGDATLDARVVAQLTDDVSRAVAEHDHERVSVLAAEALALWRGPALADVALASPGRADAERLEELRLRTLEQRFEAELALGRDKELVGELQVLVGQNPYRERFVAQLMVALYRSGRHADALDAYEKTRAALANDVGLQPSAELQQLSGQIVRQEPKLRRPAAVRPVSAQRTIRRRVGRVSELVLVGAAVAAAMAFTASGSGPHRAAADTPTSTRVALVLPRAPSWTGRDDTIAAYVNRLGLAANAKNLTTETIVANESDSERAVVDAVASKLHDGAFDLVLWVGDGAAAQALAAEVRAVPETKFVFLDASLETLDRNGVRNASAIRFADEEASELVGYLSGLVAPRGSPSGKRADVVSVVGGTPTLHAKRVIAGFQRGVRRALPAVAVLVDYAYETVDRTRCEQLANSQIDRGSDVVFAAAGSCGLGALAVARTRGIWGVGGESGRG